MKWEIKPSPLHGVGLFATEDIRADYLICWGMMTEHPRGMFNGTPLENLICEQGDKDIMTWAPHMWINHSDNPNCECRSDRNAMEDDLHAIRDIPAGEELTIDYRTVCEWSARRP
jgi:hypothetical protein